ncbi:MAG TPA: multiheme c-type cytochrome, partial [Thermoanaerobaculia bacterium]|nr:multiheme c-type cytochrome [Thermoanaerobaculia bacterium]
MTTETREPVPARRRYVPAVGPRLSRLLAVVFGLFALLCVNSAYLLGVRGLEAATGRTYQNWAYLLMFLGHLGLGLVLAPAAVVFGLIHLRNARTRPNRRAVRIGYALFTTTLLLIASGVVLTRVEGILEIRDPQVRTTAYWIHVLTPLVAGWLFVLHRLAGKRIRWRVGRRWAIVAGVAALAAAALHLQDPRRWNEAGPESGEKYFFPSLARTSTGGFIPSDVLMADGYCKECHGDVHAGWSRSAHRFSSFNNPTYAFSVRETRRVALERDGDLQASRWCAGCHDPVIFFGGKFDDPEFDDENDPTALAGITCTSCHAITHVNSVRGNADFTIEEPLHYPFAFSESASLRWINRQLVKSKPELHKRTFLKPLHQRPDFCGSCHKVHLPPELNRYKWIRGQNHYDSFWLSGVSGHSPSSFYYPPKAVPKCADCHMPLERSDDFGARDFDGTGERKIHDHLFVGANTGIAHLADLGQETIDRHRAMLESVGRVDLFGVREGEDVDAPLIAPLRPSVPALVPGRTYLLEAVIRTVKIGHHLTQGTVDSNEIWLELVARSGDRIVGRSGGLGEGNSVDPWSHFVNVYMLDREGRRIDRRNAQDIFVPLYNHQIPPGAADVVHYRLAVPRDLEGPLTVEARLRYRKFDTTYLRYVFGEDYVNDLPIVDMASDSVTFPVGASAEAVAAEPPAFPEWQRWNDFGIGLLRKGGSKAAGELAGAEAAFRRVEELGRPDGPLNLARVYLAEGRVEDRAIEALARAAAFDPPAPSWTLAWLRGLVNKQNGYLDDAIADFRGLVAARGGAL